MVFCYSHPNRLKGNFIFHVNKDNPWLVGRAVIIRNQIPSILLACHFQMQFLLCAPRYLLWLQSSYPRDIQQEGEKARRTLFPPSPPQQARTLPRSIIYYLNLLFTHQTFVKWPLLAIKETRNYHLFLGVFIHSK